MNNTTHTNADDYAELRNGILYAYYFGDVTVDSIHALGERLITELDKADKDLAPLVLIADPEVHLKIDPTHLSKVTSIPAVKRISVVCIVGLKPAEAKIGQIASKMFLNNKLFVVKDLAEAESGARKYLNETRPILEQ